VRHDVKEQIALDFDEAVNGVIDDFLFVQWLLGLIFDMTIHP
jgi:hypothetical protein